MTNISRLRTVLKHDNAECLDTALSPIPQPPEVPYCYYKQVTNVIRTVKVNVLSYLRYVV
jgi:hypothetical protein